MNSDIKLLTHANEELHSQISDTQQHIAQQKSTNDTQDALLNDLQNQLRAYEQENSKLQFNMIEIDHQRSQLSEKTQEIELQKSKTDEANENLKHENSSLIQKVKMYDSHFGELKGLLGDSTNVEQIQSEIKDVLKDSANLKVSLKEITKEFDFQIEENQLLSEHLLEMEGKFNELTHAKELKEKEFEQTKLNQNKLETEYLRLKSDMMLLKEHFEQEMEDKLTTQRTQLEQQHKDNVKTVRVKL